MYNRDMKKTKTLSENVTEEEIQQVREHIREGGHIEYIDTKHLQVSRDRLITKTFIGSIEKNTRYEFDGVNTFDGKLIAYFSNNSTCY
jgi:hypothetical protein